MHPYYTVGAQIVEAYRVHHKVRKADAKKRAIEMLDLSGPAPDVPPHVLLDERLHSEEPPMTRRWRCIVIVMLCCRLASVSSTPPGTASFSRSGRR